MLFLWPAALIRIGLIGLITAVSVLSPRLRPVQGLIRFMKQFLLIQPLKRPYTVSRRQGHDGGRPRHRMFNAEPVQPFMDIS